MAKISPSGPAPSVAPSLAPNRPVQRFDDLLRMDRQQIEFRRLLNKNVDLNRAVKAELRRSVWDMRFPLLNGIFEPPFVSRLVGFRKVLDCIPIPGRPQLWTASSATCASGGSANSTTIDNNTRFIGAQLISGTFPGAPIHLNNATSHNPRFGTESIARRDNWVRDATIVATALSLPRIDNIKFTAAVGNLLRTLVAQSPAFSPSTRRVANRGNAKQVQLRTAPMPFVNRGGQVEVSLTPTLKPQVTVTRSPSRAYSPVTRTDVKRFPISRVPNNRTKEKKTRGSPSIIPRIFDAFDKASEAAEILDCLYSALPAAIKKAANQPGNDADSFGQYGTSGAQWKAPVVAANFDKIDPVKAAGCIAANHVEDKAIGAYHKAKDDLRDGVPFRKKNMRQLGRASRRRL